MNTAHLTFDELAGVCRAELEDGGDLSSVDAIADALKRKYPELDRELFMEACGYRKTAKERGAPSGLLTSLTPNAHQGLKSYADTHRKN